MKHLPFLCLIFEQTKSLLQRWLLYGIGTLFSIAVLYVVTSIVLKLTINVAAALWSASIVNHILDTGSEGFSSQALQQGGIGLVLTVLIVSVPPMAAMFFQGTLGNFMPYAVFGGGAGARPGPQGQPPGMYGYGGAHGAIAGSGVMKLCRWLLFGFMLLLNNLVHAEGVCPPGMFPTNPPGTQGPVGCAPIPGYNNNQQQAQPQLAPSPLPLWVSRWGAIATDSVKGSLGAVTGLSDEAEARSAALKDCANNGGQACKINVVYGNECAVMVVGKAGYNFAANASMDRATKSAMQTCGEVDTNCHVYYSACSLPVQIQ